MFDIYKCNNLDTARFTLGKNGTNKLFVLGLNPSTANKDESDPTLTRVRKVSENNGYDGFVMLNLYPLRSTDPKKLPTRANKKLLENNIKEIVSVASEEKAKWGRATIMV